MKKIDNSIDKLREKKKRFIAREIAIRDSAISLLKEKGLESVTISLIADHACIGKGTIYKHFLSKTEILMRIVADYQKNICDSIQIYINKEVDKKNPFGVVRKYFSLRRFDPSLDRLVRNLIMILENNVKLEETSTEIRALKEGLDAYIISSIKSLIKAGRLKDFPATYYHFAYISFVDIIIDRCVDGKFQLDASKEIEFLEFISNIGSSMGRTLKQ